ncbi:MAG: TIGR04013 family B12-binding domain/radical SAM domain-containing protein, partial [Candidatus Heimdallarchaeaceae archaeon]
MKENSVAIIFDLGKKNFYSLTPLIATLDQDDRLQNLEIYLTEELNIQFIRNVLKKHDRIIIAVSFRTAQLADIYEMMKDFYSNLSSEEFKKLIFIAGGSHPSGDPLSTLRIGFDFAFIGEAEVSLPHFLNEVLQKSDIFSTPGIAYIKEDSNTFEKTQKPDSINLNDYPFISKKRALFPPLEITRGCSFGCTFCQVPNLFNHNIRHRSPDFILDTIKWMVPRKLNDIRFITPNSFGYMSYKAKSVNKEAVLHLLSSIRKIENIRNLFFGTFPGEVRPETVSEEFMLEIKPYITNRRISLGLQSGSNRILKSIRRGHSVEEGLEAIDILLETDFKPVVDIIIGIPGAIEEDEMQTL